MEQRKQLYAFLNTVMTSKFNKEGISCGYANGYVAIPPEHPMYGKGYDEVDVSIHGGLTFGEKKSDISGSFNSEWWRNIEKLGFTEDIPDDYWVFGFDTCHAGDGLHLDRDWCVEETLYLKNQLNDMDVHVLKEPLKFHAEIYRDSYGNLNLSDWEIPQDLFPELKHSDDPISVELSVNKIL